MDGDASGAELRPFHGVFDQPRAEGEALEDVYKRQASPGDVLSFCQVADDRVAGTGQSGLKNL